MTKSEPGVVPLRIKVVPLRIKEVRTQAIMSMQAVIELSGISYGAVYKIESGKSVPRVAALLRIAYALSVYLSKPVVEVLDDLLPDDVFESYLEISRKVAEALANATGPAGRLKVKRKFVDRVHAATPVYHPKKVSLLRLQELYGRANIDRETTMKLTGLSARQLGDLFNVGAEVNDNIALVDLLILSAAYAPVTGESARRTMFYILQDDLDALDRERESLPGTA